MSSGAGSVLFNTGTTEVTGALNSGITSTLTLGATLKGTGTLGDFYAKGTVAPGLSIGTLHVVGTYYQLNGSTLEIEFDENDNSDLVNVTGNTVIESGASLVLQPELGGYAAGDSYTFIRTTTGVTGTFDSVTTDNSIRLGGLTPTITYNTNSVVLTLTGSGGGGTILHDNDFMISLASDYAKKVIDLRSNNFNVHTGIRLLEKNPCMDLTNKATKKGSITPYGQYSYSAGEIKATSNNRAGKYFVHGPVIGCDFGISEDVMLGLGFNPQFGEIKDKADQGKMDSYTLSGAVYSQITPNPHMVFTLAIEGGWSHHDIKHNVTTGGVAKAKTDGWDIEARLEWNPVICIKGLLFKPIVAGRYFKSEIDGYTEKGGAQNMRVSDDDFHMFDIETGAAVAWKHELKGVRIVPQVYATRISELNSSDRYVKTHLLESRSDEFEPVDHFKKGYTKLGGTLLIESNDWLSIYFDGHTTIAGREDHNFEVRGGLQVAF